MHKVTLVDLLVAVMIFVCCLFILNGSMAHGQCLKLSGNAKQECVIRIVDKFLSKKRVDIALAFVNAYQIEDKNFYATDCHGVVHYIGDRAFALYKQGYRLDYGKYTDICVYGFYHAFTSSFILLGEFDKARDFCGNLDLKSKSSAPSCYHGIGHGAIYNFYEDFALRDPQDIINRSIELCLKVLDKDYKINECVSGVYDGIGDQVLKPEYKNVTPDIMFGYCKNQPKKYKPNCYEMIAHLVYRKTKLDFKYLVNYVLTSPTIEEKKSAISGLALIYIVDLADGNINDGINVCKVLPTDFKAACFKSMGYKLADDEVNKKHYEVLRKFCNNNILGSKDSELCFELGVETLLRYYNKEDLKALCVLENIDVFRNQCLNQLDD